MTDRYGVIGNPIAHSRSPLIHQLFACQLDDDISYQRILAPADGFEDQADRFFAEGGLGLNVTIPFKEQAFRYADSLSPRASCAQAVNTLTRQPDGQIVGDNTDGYGLLADLKRLRWPLEGRRILLLGAGGAARGVLGPLLEAGPEQVRILNRTAARAEGLARDFADLGRVTGAGFDRPEVVAVDLVINATSASLQGELPMLPDGLITGKSYYCYDMMYGVAPTPFLRRYGCNAKACADGLGMLVAQAAESFRIWRGTLPEIAPVIDEVRKVMIAEADL